MIVCVFKFWQLLGSLQSRLLCIVGELAGRGSVAVAVGVSEAEFLIVEIMQSHDCAKYLRICVKFGVMNAKQ